MPFPSIIAAGGCLFWSFAWIGIVVGTVCTLISSVASLVTKKGTFVATIRVLGWLVPVTALLIIVGEYCFMADMNGELSPDPIKLVRELRITTGIALGACAAALVVMLVRVALARRGGGGKQSRLTPQMILVFGGLLIICVHVVFAFP